LRRSRDAEFWDAVRQQLRERAEATLSSDVNLHTLRDRMLNGDVDPYSAAAQLVAAVSTSV
jgi:hypothetical protein